jgi:hypothetical protein
MNLPAISPLAPRRSFSRAARALKTPALALTLLALASATGCASSPAPSFRVVEARVEETTDTATVVAFYIEGVNESRDPIPLRDIRFTTTVGGTPYEARRAGEATLARFSTRRLRIPAAFPTADFEPGTPFSIDGVVRYEANGAFARTLYDAGWVDHSVAFSGTGTLAQPGQAPTLDTLPEVDSTEDRPTLRPRTPVGAATTPTDSAPAGSEPAPAAPTQPDQPQPQP